MDICIKERRVFMWKKINDATITEADSPSIISEYIEMNNIRRSTDYLGEVKKEVRATGLGYVVQGDVSIELASNNLFAQYRATSTGKKKIFAQLANYDKSGVFQRGKLKAKPFLVPSGMLDNEDNPLRDWEKEYTNHDYVHPDIAYDDVGVGGYKYWMIASLLPALNSGGVTWEDEDLFVSNNGTDWMRVKSLYEPSKSYHAPNVSLPQQGIEQSNSRKNGFLPCPAQGQVLEMSVPASNGAAEMDRESVTVAETLPWKHDPAIMIDGGYVYTYHSFHVPIAGRTGGKNRFVVCVRSNDGVNWEVIRADGSTMLITEETSRQIFTKDAQGRYNFMYYSYSTGYTNPKVLKYGEGDYELIYGNNYALKWKGTTPYSFDFTTSYPFKELASGNHPDILLDKSNGSLYYINNDGFYISNDRGVSFTKYSNYPAWLGGLTGIPYKKAMCFGEGGKVVLVEAQRLLMPAPKRIRVSGQNSSSNRTHQVLIYTYDSIADMVSKATNGLNDGYIDLQIAKVNYETGERDSYFYPYVSTTGITSNVNNPSVAVQIGEIDVVKGDILFLYVTLNSRNGGKIVFCGLDIF